MIDTKSMKAIELFYSDKFPLLLIHKDIYQQTISMHKDEYLKVTRKILNMLDISYHQEKLANEIYDFMLYLLADNLSDRINKLYQMIEKFIGIVEDKKLEETIYAKIISYTIFILNKELHTKQWYEEFIKNLNLLFDLDKNIIGLQIKHKVQTHISQKSKSLHINSLHFLMTSTSHMQNNLLSPVESQNRYYEKYLQADLQNDDIKKQKILKLINKNKTVLDEYKIFTQRLSTLFCTFESKEQFDNIKNIDFLYFLLDLVFVNGVNIKYKDTKLKVTLSNTQDIHNQHIIMYENILIASIYALVENCVEANAKNISFDIHNDINSDEVEIFIINDGDEIMQKDIKHLFYDHYSTKQQSGLGLSITKRWLKETSSHISFVSSDENQTIFKITLPLWRT